ncbi:MAG: InlB B-repeat-containing protein [Romboutsia sp.]|nr:InlB B-repeat-containing protein [Romboutsia sp.]
MAVSLSLSLSESKINQAENTSLVTAKLYAKSNSGSYNSASRSGYITIDGTKYTFSHSFGKNTTTLLATKSKTITHNADGSKSITVKGWYSTDVSSGNISTSKTMTLTKINRSFTVTLNNNGSISTKTKTYGSNLVLDTPTRTGYVFGGWCTGIDGSGTNYGTVYTTNAAATLYAKWTEITSTIKYYSDNINFRTDTAYYTQAYSALDISGITKTGYTLQGWSLSSDALIVNYSPGELIKSADSIPSALSLYAVWNANEYSAEFDGNGNDEGQPPSTINNITYNTSFTFPIYDPDVSGSIKKLGYEFKGWSTSSTSTVPQYLSGETITWLFPENTTFYAIWGSITIQINYYRARADLDTNFNNVNSYVLTENTSIIKYNDYRISDSVSVPNLVNYTFTGLWTLSQPNQKIYTEYGVSFPAGIVPYDYDIINNVDGYLKANDYIYSVTDTVNIYPVYKDNTPTLLSYIASMYEYIPASVTELNYFEYLSGETNRLNSSIVNENIVVAAKFRTSTGASGVSINTSELNVELVSNTTPATSVSLNNVFFRSVYNEELDVSDLYMIYRNTGNQSGGVLTNYQYTEYLLNISNIEDSFGKSLDNITLLISPPKVIRDVNNDGDAVAFFTEAPDYTDQQKLTDHTDNELWNNGILISNNYLINSDDFETYLTSYIPNTINIKSIEELDLIKLLKRIPLLNYPVGSYYESSLSAAIPSGESEPTSTDLANLGITWFDPNYAWGGTWVLETSGVVHISANMPSDIGEDVYHISGANTNNGVGNADGGETAHTLTINEMPSHGHRVHVWDNAGTTANAWYYDGATKTTHSGARLYSGSSSSWVASGSTANAASSGQGDPSGTTVLVGGGQSHNIMQPYIIVYRWHRTV